MISMCKNKTLYSFWGTVLQTPSTSIIILTPLQKILDPPDNNSKYLHPSKSSCSNTPQYLDTCICKANLSLCQYAR